ncbi:MAG: phytoene desaturase family protein [Actinomycetes bacterium]
MVAALDADVAIIGAGHNGLIAACYLARAGRRVVVLEQSDKPGGGSRTDATIPELPDFRFDTHSVAHNILNITGIPEELDLAGAGLDYVEMDPFAAGFFPDGRVVRFHRSLEQTVEAIAAIDPDSARAYERFVRLADPLVDVSIAGFGLGGSPGRRAAEGLRRLRSLGRGLRRSGGPLQLARDVLGPYGSLLERHLPSDLTRAPVAAFAAHSSAGPHMGGSAFFAIWQAAYHRMGQHHAVGGSQALADALVRRLQALGGEVRSSTSVTRILTSAGRVTGLELADGQLGHGRERPPAEVLAVRDVVAAIDPRTTLLGLLDPPLGGREGVDLAATHRGNAVQMLVHVAVSRLPDYPGARPGDWNGLQSHVDTLDELTRGFLAAEARRLPDPAPTYAFTTSALDDSLAPPGCHTLYLACPCAPFEVEGGWQARREEFAERMLDSMERHAPGFRSTILGMSIRTPADMARELAWPGAHPMVLDISLDQLGPLRPTRALASHRTPVDGLYISGAGTAPVGGIAGLPGKAAAMALLKDGS